MSTSNSIKIIGQSIKVVEHDGLTIEESIGNVATKNDDISLALVTITKPTCEPWLTLLYDEYIHVIEGYIDLQQENDNEGSKTVLKVTAGQTVFIPKGSRIQPVFPVPSKYIPVCLPAFSPERCIREEGTELSDVSARLNEFHHGAGVTTKASKLNLEKELNKRFDHINTLYHMCQTSLYEKAMTRKSAYFPPSHYDDGKFTHATDVPAKLIATANHFYASTEGEWLCLELDRELLKDLGIVTLFECAKPVGDIDADGSWEDTVFPHIFGGIPVHLEGVVTQVYEMKRNEEGIFLSIDGLVEQQNSQD
mmetsp:Transcript_20427/g.43813  ORF Transcript_20427/g.43813 Transcript_20427/m.43813 type:complete len:308 (-) Transcript_20427:34-957(-)|eukprot:CAMPEP_0172554040 /NCGR_PEP_ID=MMETSP1067-20121228/52894_1 /TAXON_ID=265564 ORGANISM="Thalassiosira punctigera, Strain Tpunct2005C2" /NCGR_SAMPLE_ID=MMETSP1067 /ASSEMBLY_ACC=CAM_ASM_000444 /LENGTH=307 /DNA_ID=CAMNT_0013342337 /DNA_START=189 /DNA_END=1112 /DNA_ORIENTATION=+